MQVQTLYTYLRRELKDVPSPTIQNVFWDDRQLNLALNAAVNILTNLWLIQENTDMLSYLYSSVTYPRLVNFNTPNALPNNYMHYISATVLPESDMAKMYIGASVDEYYNVRHNGCFITGNNLRFTSDGDMECGGTLHYWRQPAIIPLSNPATTFNEDYPQEVYLSTIAHEAALLLAYKETPSQREIKMLTRNIKNIGNIPPKFVNYKANEDALNIRKTGANSEAKEK